jgi:hypothetical protein
MVLAKLFRTGGGNHASLYSPNPCRCGGDLFRRVRCCISAGDSSKRRSSTSRTFEPRYFNCHELHDVLQLAVGELPNKLRHSHTAPGPGQLNLCSPPVELDGERGMPRGLHFDPVSLSNELRPTILNNWSMITVTRPKAAGPLGRLRSRLRSIVRSHVERPTLGRPNLPRTFPLGLPPNLAIASFLIAERVISHLARVLEGAERDFGERPPLEPACRFLSAEHC